MDILTDQATRLLEFHICYIELKIYLYCSSKLNNNVRMSESVSRKGRPGDNWEISISSPTNLEVDPGLERENQKLSPRPQEGGAVENISTDECWLINIKAPATLSINRGEADTEGNQVDRESFCYSNFLLAFVYNTNTMQCNVTNMAMFTI